MQSCTVHIKADALHPDNVVYAAKPKAVLKAIPFGSVVKQVVRKAGESSSVVFSVFDVSTSFPANLTGMAIFMTITNKSGVVVQVKGKVNKVENHLASFDVEDLTAGFYNYDITIKARNYSQKILEGSYVVNN